MSQSYVRLTLGKYVIQPCKSDQKISQQLCLEVTSELRYKNNFRITLGS